MRGNPEETQQITDNVGIVVTAPSSPDTKGSPNGSQRRFPSTFLKSGTYKCHTRAADNIPTNLSETLATQASPSYASRPASNFQTTMESLDLPEPGPAYFAARRALWLKPTSSTPVHSELPARLQELLDEEGPLDSDAIWRRGLEKVWKGVIGGGVLKRRLPLRYLVRFLWGPIIKVLQAGWIRDGTWPQGYPAPEPDDELTLQEDRLAMPATTSSHYSSQLTTPMDQTTTSGTPGEHAGVTVQGQPSGLVGQS
ncbi:hypothetical protein PHLCEN_2v1644 [Hermanssonia centrifuga]|uniref:Uncharacterized protein n=1 Tax=Hermanssonia centrifuga TaxID=98765 RepID=A0A2R6RZT2_9APHY|nr:hypothetical protein PHLCEN_2v1644 [Hermanssonia centrifuga]